MRPSTILEDYASPDPDIYRILKKGEPQHFIFQENDPPPFYELTAQDYVGKPKGVKQVAYERGLWRDGMVLRDNNNPERSLFHVLQKCPDFQQFVKSILQEEIEKSGHVCDFLPKFHCELSPIERVWAKSKRYVRDYAENTRQTMKKNIIEYFRYLILQEHIKELNSDMFVKILMNDDVSMVINHSKLRIFTITEYEECRTLFFNLIKNEPPKKIRRTKSKKKFGRKKTENQITEKNEKKDTEKTNI